MLGFDTKSGRIKGEAESVTSTLEPLTKFNTGGIEMAKSSLPKTHHSTNFVDHTGKRFSVLTVIQYLGHQEWLCRCDCGRHRLLVSSTLKRDHKCSHQSPKGYSKKQTVEQKAYYAAQGRCAARNGESYQIYRHRGIEFRFESFEEFLNEVGYRPTSKHSLDRINNNGHYEKGNVRWATATEQNQNQSTTVNITINGVTLCQSEWARRTGIPHNVIGSRRTIQGWCGECAVLIPRSTRGHRCDHPKGV